MSKSYFKIVILTLLVGILSLPLRAEKGAQGHIHFITGKWGEILKKARTEHKMIFVDCNASWCGPCKKMERTIFQDSTVITLLNNSFISVKCDIEKNELPTSQGMPKITTVPFLLFIDATSDRVVHSHSGAIFSPAQFLKVAKIALNPTQNIDAKKRLFEEGRLTTFEELSSFLRELDDTNYSDLRAAVLKSCIQHLDKKVLATSVGWMLFKKEVNTTKLPCFDTVWTNRDFFYGKLGKQEVYQTLQQIITNSIISYAEGKTYCPCKLSHLRSLILPSFQNRLFLQNTLSLCIQLSQHHTEAFEKQLTYLCMKKIGTPEEPIKYIRIFAAHFRGSEEVPRFAQIIEKVANHHPERSVDLYSMERGLWLSIGNQEQVSLLNKKIATIINKPM